MTRLRELGLQLMLAAFLSLVLWMFVTINTNPDRTALYSNIPIDIKGLSPGLVIVDDNGLPRSKQASPGSVSVVVATDQGTLGELSQSDLEASVDLNGLRPGAHTVEVEAQSNRSNVRFIRIDPESVPIRLERVVTDTLPITIVLRGTLPFGFERDDPEIRLDGHAIAAAEVRGPESQVERVVAASNTINLDQLRTTFASPMQLQALDANGDVVEGVELIPEIVQVTVPVRSFVGLKRVPIIGDIVGSPALGYIVKGIQSDPALITLVGSSRLLDRIDRVETEQIAIDGATSTITREVSLRLLGVQPQEGEPTTARVTVEIGLLEEPVRVQLRAPVQVVGLAEGLDVNLSSTVLDVSLEAYPEAFVQLASNALVATIDATGLVPGTYQITPRLSLPEDIRLTDALPEVTLSLLVPPTPIPAPTFTPLPLPTSTPEPEPPTPTATTVLRPTATPEPEPPTPEPTEPEPTATPEPPPDEPLPDELTAPSETPPPPDALLPPDSSPAEEASPDATVPVGQTHPGESATGIVLVAQSDRLHAERPLPPNPSLLDGMTPR